MTGGVRVRVCVCIKTLRSAHATTTHPRDSVRRPILSTRTARRNLQAIVIYVPDKILRYIRTYVPRRHGREPSAPCPPAQGNGTAVVGYLPAAAAALHCSAGAGCCWEGGLEDGGRSDRETLPRAGTLSIVIAALHVMHASTM